MTELKVRKIGVLGAGGLGRSATTMLEKKTEFNLVAIADTHGFVYEANGIDATAVNALPLGGSVKELSNGQPCEDAVAEMIARNKAGELDAIFLAIPNIPNTFLPSVIERFCDEGFNGVIVDALKRTSAVEQVLKLSDKIRNSGVTYVTGAGATPGLLTAAANLAAQSYSEIDDITIWFGVGIANWDAYRATIREDIAHMPGYDVEKVKTLSDADIENILDGCNGVLELHHMEHADDVILEKAGIVQRAKVDVGGLVDTRHPVKPTQTKMILRGKTFEGKESEHSFSLGNETSMAANVLGPAFGWMKSALEFHDRGIHGLFTCVDLMPKFVR